MRAFRPQTTRSNWSLRVAETTSSPMTFIGSAKTSQTPSLLWNLSTEMYSVASPLLPGARMGAGNLMRMLGYSLSLIKLSTGNIRINNMLSLMARKRPMAIMRYLMIYTSIATHPYRILAIHISGRLSNLLRG